MFTLLAASLFDALPASSNELSSSNPLLVYIILFLRIIQCSGFAVIVFSLLVIFKERQPHAAPNREGKRVQRRKPLARVKKLGFLLASGFAVMAVANQIANLFG